ncbi:MAG: hypothetical protein OEV44_08635 [Spirochaetota bacterium]|nr:hypothetical protein [Spirochaetota bacterium]
MKLKIKYFVILPLTLIFILLNTPLFSVEIKLSINKTLIYLTGEQIELIYSVKHNPDEKLIINESDIHLKPDLFYNKILNSPYIKRKYDLDSLKMPTHKVIHSNSNGQNIIEHIFRYSFQLFEVDNLMISTAKFTFTNNDQTFLAYSPYAFIHIIPPKSKDHRKLSFKDISEPFIGKHSMFAYTDIILYITVFLFIIIIVFFIKRIKVWYYITYDSLGTPFTQVYTFFYSLKKHLINNNSLEHPIKDVYSDLLTNMKFYLERKYRLSTTEMTSEEIIDSLAIHVNDQQTLSNIKQFFNICNLIKFAERTREINEVQNDIQLGINIISSIDNKIKV